MTKEKTLFYVGSEVQKGLFLHEIQGQISDGQWENSRPNDHWEFWCSFDENTIIVDEKKRGRTNNKIMNRYRSKYSSDYIHCQKDKYNLLNKDLLDCVSDRMLFMAKLLTVAPEQCAKLNSIPNEASSYKDYEKYALRYENDGKADEDNYYKKQIKAWDEVGFNDEYLQSIEKDDTILTIKQLRKELASLRNAMASRDLIA